MSAPISKKLTGVTIGILILCGFAIWRNSGLAPKTVQAHSLQRNGASGPALSWPCSFGIPTVSSQIPNDAQITDQPTLNCFAWQEFIALNWASTPGKRGVPDPSASASSFGAPNATAPNVWETYKSNTEVFLPGGKAPSAWNDSAPSPSCKSNEQTASLLKRAGTRVLSMSSAFGDFNLDETNQASGQWIADQNGKLIWYEIKLNQDEFNTIVGGQFYNATVQQTTASTGKNPNPGGSYQVRLPAGCLAGSCSGNQQPTVGAIELKAAWRILTDPSQYGRYLTSQAVLVNNGSCSSATMGLVGLHIIHKTVTQPQFVWATFEQVDNVPPSSPATFSNSSCQCQVPIANSCIKAPGRGTVFQNCSNTQSKGQSCTANTSPPYNSVSSSCPAYPTQVARERPISNNPTDPIVATNTAAQQLIAGTNANSVFQYYQLVDVLWSGSPQDSYASQQPGTPGPTSLSMSGATPDPSALPVANSTMETYVQNLTCLSCHVHAQTAGGTYASDFSFILGDAQAPGARAALVHKRRSLPPGLVTLKH